MNKLLTTLFITALLQSCRKEEPLSPYVPPPAINYNVLPDATQEGKNTFGCKVSGKVWVPRVPLFTIAYQDIDALISEKDGGGGGGVTCNLVDYDLHINNWLTISFGRNYFQNGIYCAPIATAMFKTTDNEWYSSRYHTSSDNCITITRIDSVNNIISGIFNFTLYNDSLNLNDKIELTEGRFDLKYSQQ